MRFHNWKKPEIKHNIPTKWNWVVAHPENLIMGNNVDIGAFSYLQAQEGIEIEDNVQIGGGCKIYSIDTIGHKKGRVILKRNCCIGANSVIMPGITIGENAIVGALTFVDKDIPTNKVYFRK